MKKCFKYLFLLVVCSFLVSPVYAKDIDGCSILGSGIKIDEKIANTVHIIILVIQVVSPVLLVIFGMLDLTKAIIAGKEDEIKKNQMVFVKRIIAAVLVFFVFVILLFVFSIKRLKTISNDTTKLVIKNHYCQECGSPVKGLYCNNCGTRQE